MSTAKLENFINGRFVPPSSGKYIENINPATTRLVNYIPDSDATDINAAVKAARAAYPAWSKLHFSDRAAYLDKMVTAIREQSTFKAFIEAESADMGKPVSMMESIDMPCSIDQLQVISRMALSSTTPYYQMADAVAFEHRSPIGIVGLICPWNFPLLIFCTKIAPALVCGNCCILKPSELSPTTAWLMCRIMQDIDLPPGVLNVVHGYGPSAGEPLVAHANVAAISFTGGSLTGSRISAVAAPMLKKLQLELGGKNPSIVFDDCYLDETAEGIAEAAFYNTGQVCCGGSKLLVQRGIAETLIQKLKSFVREKYSEKIGDPRDPKAVLGPLVSRVQFDKVCSFLKLARQEGGRIVLGGECGETVGRRIGDEFRIGFWVEPTIVVGLDATESECAMQEMFGPILTVHTFETEEEALRIANSVRYGLAASVWTRNGRRGQRMARELEAGSVWINCYEYSDGRMPFGGFKDSGLYRENGMHSIEFFSEIKSIVSKL